MPIFNDYLLIGKGLNANEVLQAGRDRILAGREKENRDFTKLEAYLNSVFYGPKESNSITSRLQEAASAHYEEKLSQTFEAYNFENNYFSASNSSGKINLTDRTSFSHKEFINYSTIQQRFWEAKFQLESLAQSKNPEEDYEKIINDLQRLMALCEQLLDNTNYISYRGNTKVFYVRDTQDIIKEIDELYSQVTFVSSMPLTVGELGEVFEKALTAVGSGKDIDELTDEALKEVFNSKTIGQTTANRGGIVQLSGVEYTLIEKEGKNNKRTVQYEVLGENGSIIKIGGEFAAKQGKMDVSFTMPNSNEHFRVSAKNWKTIDSKRDFGETDLESALLRSGGFINTMAYGVRVGAGRGGLQNAHDYAKACVVLDVLMGYSQETAYADTVIINDRGSSSIKVYSIYNLLNNFNYNSVLGYPDNIRESIRSNFNTSRAWGPQGYENKILSELKKYKLRISSTILN